MSNSKKCCCSAGSYCAKSTPKSEICDHYVSLVANYLEQNMGPSREVDLKKLLEQIPCPYYLENALDYMLDTDEGKSEDDLRSKLLEVGNELRLLNRERGILHKKSYRATLRAVDEKLRILDREKQVLESVLEIYDSLKQE